MAKRRTLSPQHDFVSARDLVEVLQSAVDDRETRSDLQISLHVCGGVHGESYDMYFRANGAGLVEVRMTDELRKRNAECTRKRIGDHEFSRLVREINKTGIVGIRVKQPRFLPDTVTGHLVISHRELEYSAWFVADPVQASNQKLKPIPELRAAVDIVFRWAAKLCRQRSLKP